MTVACPIIEEQIIRSQVTIESLSWGVPGSTEAQDGHVLSFSISKSRGNPVGQMSCTLETWIKSDVSRITSVEDNGLGACIRVYGGKVKSPSGYSLPQLFTGYIKDIKLDPHWDDARKVIMSITAEDVFVKLRRHKFSRRFKMKDAAFAIITDGNRRIGGNMNQLRRGQRSGSNYQNAASGADQFGENSPLIKTPDFKPKTPQGRYVNSGKAQPDTPVTYRFAPSHIIMKPGDRVVVKLMDEQNKQRKIGNGKEFDLDTSAYKPSCFCYMNPNFDSTAGNKSQGIAGGFKALDITKGDGSPGSVSIIPSDHATLGKSAGSFLIKMKDWYPFKIIYIDPETKGTASLDVAVVYPHDHRDISRGGPAVGVYDTMQL